MRGPGIRVFGGHTGGQFGRQFGGQIIPLASISLPAIGVTNSIVGPEPTCATTDPGAPGIPTVTSTCSIGPPPTSQLHITKSTIGTTNYYQIIIKGAVVESYFPAIIDPRDYFPIGFFATGDSWSVNACNTGTSCSSTPGTFTCSSNTTPWIFVDGDVHSNTRINTPGGP